MKAADTDAANAFELSHLCVNSCESDNPLMSGLAIMKESKERSIETDLPPSMAMMESRGRILRGDAGRIFSTEHVASCSPYSQGCEGGFPYLIAFEIWPRRQEFVEHEQLLMFSLAIFGNVVICLMSFHW